ncbi:MAG: SEC-C domain-containing protein [Syntrophobacteraceae bacterium]
MGKNRRRMKFGRNELCWCGSGIKYKKCHSQREGMEAVNPFIIEQRLRRHFSQKYCLHPEAAEKPCEGQIINAHTIQRNGGLSRIARNGHVYGFKGELKTLLETNGFPVPKLIGTNKASTFTGFCGVHDAKTFEQLERRRFTGTPQQCFLLAYRALCREIFTKKAAHESSDLFRDFDKGRNLDVQTQIQHLINISKYASELALKRMNSHKVDYDKCLMSGDYSRVKYYTIFFSNCPDILCNGGFDPHADFSGSILQDSLDTTRELDVIYFSLIPTDQGGAAVFAWLHESNEACSRLVESLHGLPRSRISDAIVRLCFEHLENIYFSPVWWEFLDNEKRQYLVKKFGSGIRTPRRKLCLIDDHLEFADWNVLDITSNLSLSGGVAPGHD